MRQFVQVKNRKASLSTLPLVIACPQMKNNENVSLLARTASCLGASAMITTGSNKVNRHISRDITIPIRHHNSLKPVIERYKKKGYIILGIEQATDSTSIFQCSFERGQRVMLIAGHECRGIDQDLLDTLDGVIEIPLNHGPHSLNVAIAVSMAIYEYVRQIQ